MAGLWSDHFPAASKSPQKLSPCKTKGMWSGIFPFAEKPRSPLSALPSPPLARYQRCLLCRTCNSSCRLFTSSTPHNPNRQFYKCSSLDHKFFKWADEVKPDEFIDVPYCGGCTAGVCRVRKEKSGPNAGRILFMCRVKEGEGSCGYSVYQDELQDSTPGPPIDERITSSLSPTFNYDHTRPANNDSVKESTQINGMADNEVSSESDTSQHLDSHGVASRKTENFKCQETRTMPTNYDLIGENNHSNERPETESRVIGTSSLGCLGLTSRTMECLKCQENQPRKSSRRPHKRSRRGEVKAPSSLISSESLIVSPALSSVTFEHCWMVAAIRQNLSSQLEGWWGRLAFHPKPCLTTRASKSLDCDVRSPRDSTFTLQDKLVASSGDLTTLTRILFGVESYNNSLLNPCRGSTQLLDPKPFRVPLNSSSFDHPSTDTNLPNVMSKSISKAFTRAAEHLQNDFLSLLEKMDVGDYEAMSRAAEATFAALGRLLFDYRDFERRTNEYIRCATSLAEIERSMPGNEPYQRLIEHCSSERTRLDEMSSVHANAVASVSNNKKRLKSIHEDVSSAMDWLFRIEAELSCCEVEMSDMEMVLETISKNKEVLEEKYMIAENELERSRRLLEAKEAERGVAKAAFERAKELLRG